MTPDIALKVEEIGAGLTQLAKVMALPPAFRRKLVSRLGRLAIAQAKKNVKDQKTLDGSPFAPRQTKDNARKGLPMFPKMTKSKWLGMKIQSDDESLVHFFRNVGFVAMKHQKGAQALGLTREVIDYPRPLDTSKVQTYLNNQQFTTPSGKTGCTANQAAMLIRLDFLPPHLRSLPGGMAADQRFVMANVNRAQAAFLIREGRKKATRKTIPANMPARPFLGASKEQIREWRDVLTQAVAAKFRAKDYNHLLR